MGGVGEAIGLISSMMSIGTQIVQLAETAQRNREECALLKDHVHMINLLLSELKSQWMPDPVTFNTLKNLEAALNDGKELVDSCGRKRTWSLVFRTQKKGQKILAVDARISKTLQTLHIANMILIVSINKERFFMDVLEKLLRNGACRRLPQSEKEELKSSISNLTNTDNMSSDAKRVMELVLMDLTDGEDRHACGGRGGDQVARTGSGDNNEVVLRLAVSIVQLEANKAPRQNKGEIQQLVQLVQQIVNLMKQPHSSKLSRDKNSSHLLRALGEHLKDAREIVLHNQHHRNKTLLCGGGYHLQQPDFILKVAYKIEYYVQLLPVITMRKMFARHVSSVF